MGEALFELEQILRSKKENLTSQEANVLMTCKSNALKDFTIGAAAGAGIGWLATQRLSYVFRINLSVGTALVSGMWRFGRSLDSCVGHILSLDGSRIQNELANIMVKRYRDDPRTVQLISKHFYSEKVFDDSSADQPKLRWRHRNFFGDNVAYSQRTHNSDSYGDITDSDKTDMEKADEPKRVSGNSGFDTVTNPLDLVLGIPGSSEEIHHANTPSTSVKRHGRSHKRSHRRHRMRRHEASSNFQLT